MTVLSLSPASLGTQLESIHQRLRTDLPGIDRVAAALYDPKTDVLKTFVNSTEGGSPLAHYDIRLGEVPSLVELARERHTRVVADLSVFQGSTREHTRRLLEKGYRSSYTVPFFDGGSLAGFLFFDARRTGFFTPPVVEKLQVYGQLVALLLLHSFGPVRTLRSALHVASRLSHERDPETGAHLDRMSRYARVLAGKLAADRGLPDEFVEFLFLFAPIHDIGKVAIPDRVLLKKGRLTEEEFEVMKTHVSRGVAIVDDVLAHLAMDDFPHAGLLRNVVRHHHECVDGSGYPDGLSAAAIPLEARIVAVADVFDALTSERPYKSAWSEGEAIGYLRERAGSQFDPSCVDVLIERLDEVRAIRTRFPDEERWGRQSREGYSLDL